MIKQTKITFLDIDGVLNNQAHQQSIHQKDGGKIESEIELFDTNNVKQLNRIIQATGAKIVVSSSWRYGRTLADLQELFKQIGIKGEVIGRTPCFLLIHTDETYCKYNKDVFRASFRGTEIEHWISKNKGLLGVKRSQYTKYAIIDDDNDMLYWHRNNFFQTDGRYGLTVKDADNIIEFLNKKQHG